MKVEERLFSVDETAERLGVSKWTITDWIKAGRLKGTRIGKFWRVRESDLETFIADPPPLKRVRLAVPQAQTPPANGSLHPPTRSIEMHQARKAAVVARLQAMQAEGLSHQAIANRLNREREPTLSRKGTWQAGTIGKLLAQAEGTP